MIKKSSSKRASYYLIIIEDTHLCEPLLSFFFFLCGFVLALLTVLAVRYVDKPGRCRRCGEII